MRLLDNDAIEDLAVGAAVLGSGGGGDPYIGKLMAQQAMVQHGPARLLPLEALPDDALVVALGMVGAPTVAMERPFAEDTFFNAFQLLARYLGQPIDAVMTLEVGGGNALMPVPTAARLSLPMLDADAMGRALPELQMTSFGMHGLAATPLALVDDAGNRSVIETANNIRAEQLARSVVIDLGGALAAALYPLRGSQVKQAAIAGSISRAIDIGRVFRAARRAEQQPIEALQHVFGARPLFEGKVIDVQRQYHAGFARGQALITGIGRSEQRSMTVQFQNEYLIATVDGAIRATVPDLICLFDLRNATPVPVEALRYGSQVAVVAMAAPPIWQGAAGLALVGPRAFGYDMDHTPLEE